MRSLLAVLALALAQPAHAGTFPYELDVRQGSRNDALDLSPAACHPTRGCFDQSGFPCSERPGQTCELASVPAGRCSAGTSACIWPQGAGFCTADSDVPCLADAQCPGGTCDLSTADPSCACDGSLPANHPVLGEAVVCGGLLARCSDGDPLRAFGGHPPDRCEAPDQCPPRGDPSYEQENPPDPTTLTPQRDPGGGVDPANLRPMRRVRTTAALRMDAPDEVDEHGVRRFESLGRSFWADVVHEDNTATGTLSLVRGVYPCELPSGYSSERVIEGTCAIGGTFCTSNASCVLGPCEQGRFCHQAAQDGRGFVFTQAPQPRALIDSGLMNVCPPHCYVDYDYDTFEHELIRLLHGQDPDAGAQLAVDHLGGHQARTGHALWLQSVTEVIWIESGDLRCYLGGDPFRANPADNKIGRCSGSPTPCATNADCPSPETCRFCGGTHSSDPEYGMHASGVDPAAATLALPPGYDRMGLAELDLVNPGGDSSARRLGALNGVPSVLAPRSLFLISTTSAGASEYKNNSPGCAGGANCPFGTVAGGGGIGVGGTYMNGQSFPAGGSCCDSGGDITWPPELPSTPVGSLTRISDYAPGPDGIPSCFGDSDCNEVLGDPNIPGNTGSDDRPILRLDPALFGSGGVADPNRPGRQRSTASLRPVAGPTPLVAATYLGQALPSLTLRAALALREGDLMLKTGPTLCPIVGTSPECGVAGNFDFDGDGVPDPDDNCPYRANLEQTDINEDGIGAACQCGDVTGNEIANGQDFTFIVRRGQGFNDPLFREPGNCDMNADNVCDFHDTEIAVRQNCPNAIPDYDRDGWENPDDTCPFLSNPGQEDTGGISTPTPDGIGNACQCGDVTANGIVNGQDGLFITRYGLGYDDPLFLEPGNCDVTGNELCNGQDGVFTTRAGLGFMDPLNLAPRGQNCPNADPFVFCDYCG